MSRNQLMRRRRLQRHCSAGVVYTPRPFSFDPDAHVSYNNPGPSTPDESVFGERCGLAVNIERGEDFGGVPVDPPNLGDPEADAPRIRPIPPASDRRPVALEPPE